MKNDLQMLEKFDGSRVIRVMPNTPMLVGTGCTVYCPGTKVTDQDLQLVHSFLEVTGMCQCLPEHMINAVGAVTASGPAFVRRLTNEYSHRQTFQILGLLIH